MLLLSELFSCFSSGLHSSPYIHGYQIGHLKLQSVHSRPWKSANPSTVSYITERTLITQEKINHQINKN